MHAGVSPRWLAERRKDRYVVLVLHPEPFGMFHDVCEEDGQEYADSVESNHHQGLVSGEKCRHEQQIDRKPRAAAHERNHQHCQCSVPFVLDLFGSHYRRDIAAETNEHRDE